MISNLLFPSMYVINSIFAGNGNCSGQNRLSFLFTPISSNVIHLLIKHLLTSLTYLVPRKNAMGAKSRIILKLSKQSSLESGGGGNFSFQDTGCPIQIL